MIEPRPLVPLLAAAAVTIGVIAAVLGAAGYPLALWPLGMVRLVGVLFVACLLGGALAVLGGQLIGDLRRRLARDEPPALRLRLRDLGRVMANGAVLTLVYTSVLVAYVNLKPAIPLLNPARFDTALEALERALFVGVLPSQWLVAHSGAGALAFWNGVYDLFSMFMFTSLAIAILLGGTRAGAHLTFCFVVGLALDLGMTWLLPTRGPIFEHPEWFTGLRHLSSGQLGSFLQMTVEAYGKAPGTVYACAGISAMPSYHVYAWTCSVIFWRDLPRGLFAAALALAVLNWVSTVALGWHYALDGLVGAALALAVWWGSRPLFRMPPQGNRTHVAARPTG